MNKVILLIVSLLISLSLINNSYSNNNIDRKLYKWVSVTKVQIEKDYWKKVNEKIVEIFKKYRYKKDRSTLNKLEVLLKNKIRDLNEFNILSNNEKKKLNLYNNLYYRTKLLLDYNL